MIDTDEEEYYDPRPDAPPHAQHYGHGSYYKFGVHGKVFVWVNGQWIKSAKTTNEIKRFESI